MNKLLNFIKKYKKSSIGVAALAVLLVVLMTFSFGGSDTETFIVKNGNVAQSVTLSGKVQTTDKADLGFASSGRVARVFVKNNQVVTKGAILAQLEIGDLAADLKIKQAGLKSANVEIEAAKEELERVKRQEDAKVESAYRKMLSSDLELVPDDINSTLTIPTISGSYDGIEGQYKISIQKENITLPDSHLVTFGLEKTRQLISKNSSTRLGTKGLYITFPSNDPEPYRDTIWYLNIPNKSSSDYIDNFNAYNEAKKNRDQAVSSAEFNYRKLISGGSNVSSVVAEAEIQKIQSEIRKNGIYAPFSGKVTNIEKEVGENASVGEQVISMVGEKRLEVVLQVSELDVSRLFPGANVSLKIDALPGEEFIGILQTINSRETEIEGVPVYEAFVEVDPDPRIKTGMSATGTIILASKENVLIAPNYFINNKDGKNFVEIINSKGKKEEREVILGLVGTDSMVEIISGLEDGDRIVANGKE